MSTVTVSSTPVAPYTWASASFAWTAPEAGKAWQDARVLSFAADAAEDLGVTVLDRRTADRLAASSLVLGEDRRASAVADLHAPLGFAETYVDLIQFVSTVLENLIVGEVAAKAANRPTAEALAFIDAGARRPVKAGNEALALAEDASRLVAFARILAEALAIEETDGRNVAKASDEALAFRTALLRHANAVIADLALSSQPMTEEEFRARLAQARPLGFAPFRELVPGDYEYAKAVIGLELEAPVTGERAALAQATLNVDVSDVRDRGTATVPVAGTSVPFNRTYSEPPEVQATLKAGGTPAVPEVSNITATGFDVRLLATADGAPVAGTVSWSALGY